MIYKHCTRLFLLLSCLIFTACESEGIDSLISTDDGLVEVQVVLPIADSEEAETRMSGANTQYNTNQTFRGVDYIRLAPFHSNASNPIVNNEAQRLRRGQLSLTMTNSYQNGKNQVYSTLLVPEQTNAFLVYARPYGGGVDAQPADKFVYGSLIPTGIDGNAPDDHASSITFSLDKIADDGNNIASYNTYSTVFGLVAEYLTDVANATVNGQPLYKQTGDLGVLFSALSNNGSPFPFGRLYIQQKLKDIFDYRYGSVSETVTTAINDKYDMLNKDAAWGKYADLENFPNGLFLFKWQEGSHQFVVLDYETSKTEINPSIVNPSYLSYPAQLWYYTNTPIRTSTVEMNVATFNNSTWSNVLKNSNFTAKGTVSNDTKVVALENKLQYGVGRLETKVHVDGKAGTGDIPVSDLNYLQFKGVFVTHQYKAGYDFQPLATNNTEDHDPYYMIYDCEVKKSDGSVITVPGSGKWSAENQTLVLPSNAGEKIFVIIEFFYTGGKDGNFPPIPGYNGNPIYPQTYFYMVGELNPGNDSNSNPRRAFESDKVTKLFASIKNFNGAYNYVPDLSSPTLVLSLKLELQWEQTEPNSVWLH